MHKENDIYEYCVVRITSPGTMSAANNMEKTFEMFRQAIVEYAAAGWRFAGSIKPYETYILELAFERERPAAP